MEKLFEENKYFDMQFIPSQNMKINQNNILKSKHVFLNEKKINFSRPKF